MTPAPKPTAPGLPFLRLLPVSALGCCRDQGLRLPHSPPQTWVSSWGHSRQAFKKEEYRIKFLVLPPGQRCPAPPDTAGRGCRGRGRPCATVLVPRQPPRFCSGIRFFPLPRHRWLGLTAKGFGFCFCFETLGTLKNPRGRSSRNGKSRRRRAGPQGVKGQWKGRAPGIPGQSSAPEVPGRRRERTLRSNPEARE